MSTMILNFVGHPIIGIDLATDIDVNGQTHPFYKVFQALYDIVRMMACNLVMQSTA